MFRTYAQDYFPVIIILSRSSMNFQNITHVVTVSVSDDWPHFVPEHLSPEQSRSNWIPPFSFLPFRLRQVSVINK